MKTSESKAIVYFNIDLQLFAGEKDSKTEKATPKKRQDARKKGQIFHSMELSTAISLLVVFLCLKILTKQINIDLEIFTKSIYEQYIICIEDIFLVNHLYGLFIDTIILFLKTAGPIVCVALITGVAVQYVQVGFVFSMDTVKIKLNRINPLQSMKRLFSTHGLVELLKSLLKIIIIGYIAYICLKGEVINILRTPYLEAETVFIYIVDTITNIAVKICMLLLTLGIMDYGYQWWEYERDLRMTKQEAKEEYKQLEGNPETKSRIKQKQRQLSAKRMINEVPKADVVITNPTHYAVALKYDSSISSAPLLIAKGQGYIALKIKEIAKANKVEIVENKELARQIYNMVNIGEEIPPELYQAVAEILAYIYNLKEESKRH